MRSIRSSALVPRGFILENLSIEETGAVMTVRSAAGVSHCPTCSMGSRRIHSRYLRRLADLPIAGHPVRLLVKARRFYCDAVLCGRHNFTERFEAALLAPWARRTARLDHIVHHLGLALGGRPAAKFARRLMLPVSNDTLLRAVRRYGSPCFVPPIVIGIDDWAWRRNQRYGTLICDLERRRTIALLSDREPATARHGSATSRRLPWSHGIEVAATPWRRPRLCPRQPRSLIAGTSWKMPAAPSSTRYANPCARSGAPSAPQRSPRTSSPPVSGCNMRISAPGGDQRRHPGPGQRRCHD